MNILNVQTGAISQLVPRTLSNVNALHGLYFSHEGVGGYVELPSIIYRNDIPIGEEMNSDGMSSGRRKLGMIVYAAEEDRYYQLAPLSSDSLGINKVQITYADWVAANDAQKMVWLDPTKTREDIFNSTSTGALIVGSGDPNDAWREIYLNGDPNLRTYLDGNFLPLSGGTVDGNLFIEGSLYITGSAAQISATNISIADPLIFLAHGNPTNSLDLGFVAEYNQHPLGQQHTGLVRLHDKDEWTLFTGLTTDPLTSTTISRTDPTFKIDTLNANIKGNLLTSTNVFGYLSSNDVIYAKDGNSGEWGSVYTTVSTNSAKWETAYSATSSNIIHKGNSFGENVIIGSNDPYSLVFETSGTPRVTVLSGGNVGIGNTNPNYSLTVTGDVSANALRLTSGTSSTNGILFGTDVNLYRSAANVLKTDDSFIPVLNTSTTSNTVVVGKSTTDNTLEKRNVNSQVWNTTATFVTADPSFSITTNYVPKASNSTSLRNSQIFDNGTNVGVGTITPNEKLTVTGSISATDYIFNRTKLNFVDSTYTFKLSDQNCLTLFNTTTPVTAYVPSDTSEAFSVGTSVNFTTLSAIVYVKSEAGVTIRAADGRDYLRTSYSTGTVLKINSNDWLLFGDIWSDTLN
jgi:hypothetical protein